MRLRLWYLIILSWAITGVFIWWWGWAGGQHWLALQTGTCPPHGSCDAGTGGHYGYWSGFGSVIPWSLAALGGIWTFTVVHWRHVNCHEPRCPRIGRYADASGMFRYCGLHHPGWEGKQPSREHRDRMHRLHMARLEHPDHGPEQPGSV